MLGIALCSWLSWVAGTALGALFGNGPLEQFPVIEASLAFMLPAVSQFPAGRLPAPAEPDHCCRIGRRAARRGAVLHPGRHFGRHRRRLRRRPVPARPAEANHEH